MPDEGSVPDDDAVDFIIAPSLHLRARLASELGLPASKLIHLDFGFANATDLRRRARAPEAPGVGFVFGFNAAAAGDLEEGAGVLLEAFQRTAGALPAARLRVWGCGDPGLAQRYAADSRIEWLPALGPSETTEKALNRCDCVVVPSPRWTAGSSLAAHEAAHARVPVIAAAAAGLDEYVQEGVNGLTFGAGDAESLRSVLQAAAGDPAGMAALGRRGFLPSKLGDVAAMPVHVERVANVYYAALGKLRDEAAAATAAAGVAARARRAMLSLRPRGLVRRVTFGTNRDTCNYSCVMCEDHAPDSPRKLGIRSGAIKRDAEMPPALIPQLIAESQGLGLEEVIPATMGEPTMYTHFDEAFLHPLLQPSNHGEPALAGAGGGDGGGGGGGRLVRLNMTTNGSFPISAARGGPERFIEKLVKVRRTTTSQGVHAERCMPALMGSTRLACASQVGSDVKVSFNSTDPEIQKRVMVGADPDAMMNNVKLLVAARDREAAAGGNYMGITLQARSGGGRQAVGMRHCGGEGQLLLQLISAPCASFSCCRTVTLLSPDVANPFLPTVPSKRPVHVHGDEHADHPRHDPLGGAARPRPRQREPALDARPRAPQRAVVPEVGGGARALEQGCWRVRGGAAGHPQAGRLADPHRRLHGAAAGGDRADAGGLRVPFPAAAGKAVGGERREGEPVLRADRAAQHPGGLRQRRRRRPPQHPALRAVPGAQAEPAVNPGSCLLLRLSCLSTGRSLQQRLSGFAPVCNLQEIAAPCAIGVGAL